MQFRTWLFGQALTARMVRSALLTAIPLVSLNGALALDAELWKLALLTALSAALTPLVAALAVADSGGDEWHAEGTD